MILLPRYQNQNIAVFGLGKAGQATVQALSASGAAVYAWDDNEAARGAVANLPGVVLSTIQDTPWQEVQALVLSPGVPLTHPEPHPVVHAARRGGCRIIGDIELLWEACPDATYIGITGTNGKSTTTALVGHLLEQAGKCVQVGGNIGTPALSMEALGADGIYVLELSSYQLDLIEKFRPQIGVWLNISPDHLDRHGDISGYIAAKERLFMNQKQNDIAIICIDDEASLNIYLKIENKNNSSVIPVSVNQSVDNGIFVENSIIYNAINGDVQRIASLDGCAALRGLHNAQNAAAAVEVVLQLGVPAEEIERGLKSFAGLPHRMEEVSCINGVRFINDSKATNAEAAEKALLSFENIYWIVGGVAKEGGITALAPHFSRLRHAYLIGEEAQAFVLELKGKVAYAQCGTLDNALRAAARDAWGAGESAVVLLSPAAASFDQWKNFEERGDAFRTMVHQLEQSDVSLPECS